MDRHWYLCYKIRNSNRFNSIGFSKFSDADEYFDIIEHKCKNIKKHTIVPISKWIPKIFHTYILNNKLNKLYLKDKII
jgi:hypothetical protein